MSQETPRPPEQPGKTGRAPLVAVLAVVAAIAVLGALLVLWSPWNGEAGPGPDGSTSTGKNPRTSAAASSSSQSDSAQPSNGSEYARIPTVIGMPVKQAVTEVKDDFDRVQLVPDENGAGEACVVFAQDPESGEYPTDILVTLTYAGTRAECGL